PSTWIWRENAWDAAPFRLHHPIMSGGRKQGENEAGRCVRSGAWSGQPGQLVQGGEGVAHLLPLGQQVIQDRGVGGGGRVEQHDGSVVDAGQQFGIGLLRRRLIVRVPVHIGQTPEHGGVSQLLGLLQILHTVFSLRRAVELGERLSCGLLVQGLQVRQLLLECGHVRDAGHIRVVVRVVAHNVALCRHAADDVGSRFDHMPHHKEGGGGIVLFQGVQYGLCAAVL
ncbi:Stage 0 sporulation A-like protein, partial [Dysosmobacter welbionis]